MRRLVYVCVATLLIFGGMLASMWAMVVSTGLALRVGAESSSCWDGGFGPAYCCKGRAGRSECWDSFHTFESCCTEYLNTSQPFRDLLAARRGQGPLLAELGSWGDASALKGPPSALAAHRRCVNRGDREHCEELETLAATAAAAHAGAASQYIGLQHRLVLKQYPYSYFAAPVYDMFYKAKVFPSAYWGSDDYALFEVGFRALLKCGDVVVDAGANIGGYTQMLGMSVCADGQVHSFEPFRLTFQLLNANVALAGLTNVRTYHRALSNTAARTRAVGSDLRDPQQQTIWNSLVMPTEATQQHENGMFWAEEQTEDEEIQQITLDSLELPRLDFIKIDVEAMEGHVFLGGLETMRRHWPSILVEIKGFQRKTLHTFLEQEREASGASALGRCDRRCIEGDGCAGTRPPSSIG